MRDGDESAAIRGRLIEALRLDLVGPDNDGPLANEVLPQAPSRWYLTGFLVPVDAEEEQKSEDAKEGDIDVVTDARGVDDAAPPEPASSRKAYFPSSMGLTLLVPKECERLAVAVHWGDYSVDDSDVYSSSADGSGGGSFDKRRWKRQPKQAQVQVPLPSRTEQPSSFPLPGADGLNLVVTVRAVRTLGIQEQYLPAGSKSVSVFLVNHRKPASDDARDTAFAFQARIEVSSEKPVIPKPNLIGIASDNYDERVADLQFRDAYEFAVGHGVSVEASKYDGKQCRGVRTSWIPVAEVERIAPAHIEGVELGMEALSELKANPKEKIVGLVSSYRDWLRVEEGRLAGLSDRRRQTAEELFARARKAADRIEAGIRLLGEPKVLEAFRIANRAMAMAARRRISRLVGKPPDQVDPPEWRPFQLAFILMNLEGIVRPASLDREVVDLLFFPTGGGKTEAYLGLAAFTLAYRRLKNPGLASAGVSVLMRYTLRLLTLDQLGRASALMCALELLRKQNPSSLGEWPFEIGLWVGLAATPNRMGEKNDGDPRSARAKTIAFGNDDRKPAPIPIEDCPWCGTKFTSNSFRLLPNPDRPMDLRVQCGSRHCDFSRGDMLPILGVDEPIYRRLPCFIIATVDKFAAMPWTGRVGGFFGRVDRSDANGFYGPCDPGKGNPLTENLLPPDLIIQDELHLISGPMGTMVGLYESALDSLCARKVDGKRVRPKIVASTATVRRADDQIRALFARRTVDVFPPPVTDPRNSFFAQVHSEDQSHPRLYVGVGAQGKSLKVVLLRTYLALLGAGQKAYEKAGGSRNKANPADPYMTLLGYFNSLRELGGSRRITEDEVSTRLTGYSGRKRLGETEGLFADRKIAFDIVELTSRVATDKVAEAKQRLSLPFHEKDRVDVAIATNMISVGLDIMRLGLMVVLGQPKTSAEYIQATSRVGRDPARPGLVVTLFNVHKPRDRSHYERFRAYHSSFYRNVEVTSVTPFSPRALDRGLAGTVVALARQGHEPMTPPKGAAAILAERSRLDFVIESLVERAESHAALSTEEMKRLRNRVRDLVIDLLDEWEVIGKGYDSQSVELQYQREVGAAKPLLYDFLSPDLKSLPKRHRKFCANRSMRDVEPSVNLWMKTLDEVDVEESDET